MTEAVQETTDAEISPTIQPGDLVTHEDGPYFMRGEIYAVTDGVASVEWPGVDVHDGIPVERLRFVSRPAAYVCLSFHGTDDVDGGDRTYRFVHTSEDPDVIRGDVDFYGRTAGYTVESSYVPESPGEDDADT